MTRTLKALGLAVLAVCALSAVAASSASATNDKIECTGAGTCDVTASGSATFGTKASSLSVVCSTETYSATATSGAESVTVTPTYGGCTALGGNATVDVNGCDYKLTSATTSHSNTSGGNETDAPVDVECPGTTKLKITAPACTISIGTQSNLHGVSFEKEGSGSTDAVIIKPTVDGISYTSSGFGCAIAGIPSSGTDGTLTGGSATATGYVDGSDHTNSANHVGLTYNEA